MLNLQSQKMDIAAIYRVVTHRRNIEKATQLLGITPNEFLKVKHKAHEYLSEIKQDIDQYAISHLEARFNGKQSKAKITKVEADDKPIINHEYDLDKGKLTAFVEGKPTTTPLTPDEILALIDVDTTKYRLSNVYNKQKASGWYLTCQWTSIKQEETDLVGFYDWLQDYTVPKITPIKASQIQNINSEEDVCAILALQDMHFGKQGNDDIAQYVKECCLYLASKAHANYNVDELVFVIGGDMLNMDTFGGTTTKGTFVENSGSAMEAYINAYNCMVDCIATLYQFCAKLKVVFIAGNHCRLSSFHLVHALGQSFANWDGLEFDDEYGERKAFLYGDNLICFEHGDIKTNNNPLLYATEYPEMWGKSKYRTLYTGHYHSKQIKEVITENEKHGFSSKQLPSLSSSDYYHYHNKYTGAKRSALIEIHEKEKGYIGSFNYTIK